jgi:hypothetical protein
VGRQDPPDRCPAWGSLRPRGVWGSSPSPAAGLVPKRRTQVRSRGGFCITPHQLLASSEVPALLSPATTRHGIPRIASTKAVGKQAGSLTEASGAGRLRQPAAARPKVQASRELARLRYHWFRNRAPGSHRCAVSAPDSKHQAPAPLPQNLLLRLLPSLGKRARLAPATEQSCGHRTVLR